MAVPVPRMKPREISVRVPERKLRHIWACSRNVTARDICACSRNETTQHTSKIGTARNICACSSNQTARKWLILHNLAAGLGDTLQLMKCQSTSSTSTGRWDSQYSVLEPNVVRGCPTIVNSVETSKHAPVTHVGTYHAESKYDVYKASDTDCLSCRGKNRWTRWDMLRENPEHRQMVKSGKYLLHISVHYGKEHHGDISNHLTQTC